MNQDESVKVSLVDKGVPQVLSGSQPETIVVTDPATDRYNTFGFISWWQQETVRDATAMVIGAGALGNEVLKNLALMGIGRILVVDFDMIDDSNLSRSILFRASDNGRRKAEVAAEAIREINPDVAVMWVHCDVNHDIGLGVYRRMDVVIGCLDNRQARLSINEACWRLNKPWIDGAIQELLGIARVFRPNDGACYECTLTDEDYKIILIRESCQFLAHENVIQGKVPTTPTISSIIASVQTQEALKLLHDMDVTSGQALVFNGLNNDIYDMEYPIKADCPSHWVWDEIVDLEGFTAQGSTVKELLEVAEENLGASAILEAPAFVEKASCAGCDSSVEIMRPRHNMTFEEAHCATCGQLMELDVHEEITGDEAFLALSLAEIGVPPLAIIPAKTEDWQYRFFELTGDAETFFRFTSSSADEIAEFYDRRRTCQTETRSK